MAKKIIITVILVSAVSVLVTLPQPLQFICALIQLFLLPGLVFTSFFLSGKISRPDQMVLSVLLSPVLVAMLTFVVSLFAVDIYLSVNIVIIASYLLFAASLLMSSPELHNTGDTAVPRKIFIVCFAYAALIAISYLINDYLLIRADSWYHAAVIREIQTHGIPPREPLLADFSIKYMWFYHLFQALWIKRSGLTLFNALAFFNIINAFIFPYLAARFASYFTDRKNVMIVVALFAIAGLESASWILWPVGLVKALFGDVTGMVEIKRILAKTTINGSEVIKFLRPSVTWQVNWNDKFLTITVFNYSLNIFLACLILMLKKSFLIKFRVVAIVTLFILILGSFLFHIISGIVLLYVLVGSSILMYLGSRFVLGERRPLSDYYVQIVTVVLVSLFALPYFYSLVVGGNNPEGNSLVNSLFHFGWKSMLTIIFPLAVLFCPAREALKKLISGRDHVSLTLISWIVSLVILCITINLGIVGEKKLIYFLFIVIGTPIYVQIVEMLRNSTGIKQKVLITFILVLFLIPPVLTFRGFLMEKPKDRLWSKRYSITDEDMLLFDWIEGNTSKDAVIIETSDYHLSPVYTGRRNLFSSYNIIVAQDYGGPQMDLYRSIQSSVFGVDSLPHDLFDDMRRVGLDLYLVVWEKDIETDPWLKGRFESRPEWCAECQS